jgi:O-acetyl-ADP-ribose deacetylase (regulator of RNase III)
MSMRIILAAQDKALADAWTTAFEGVDEVAIHRGSILDVPCDAVVSPANSFGFMDGGIDAVYLDRFGPALQDKVRWRILDGHGGELLVGAAELVETGEAAIPRLFAAPTMRVPMVLPSDSNNPYLATRAVLRLWRLGAVMEGRDAGRPIREVVSSVAFPGMGTGVGRLPPALCARQMRVAVDEHLVRGAFRFPT